MIQPFINYCWSFYGPGQIYGHFFDNSLTKAELRQAIKRVLAMDREFCGDSFDRELVRDTILIARGATATEYLVSVG